MGVIAPECTGKKRVKIPESVRCEDVDLVNYSLDRAGKKIPIPSETMRNRRNSFATRSMDFLRKNRAVPIGVCSERLYNQDVRVDLAKCSGHAVTMIGYRCVAGKKNFLIQNSWGKGNPGCAWCETDEKAPDGSNKPSGKFWIEEKALMEMTFDGSLIK